MELAAILIAGLFVRWAISVLRAAPAAEARAQAEDRLKTVCNN